MSIGQGALADCFADVQAPAGSPRDHNMNQSAIDYVEVRQTLPRFKGDFNGGVDAEPEASHFLRMQIWQEPPARDLREATVEDGDI